LTTTCEALPALPMLCAGTSERTTSRKSSRRLSLWLVLPCPAGASPTRSIFFRLRKNITHHRDQHLKLLVYCELSPTGVFRSFGLITSLFPNDRVSPICSSGAECVTCVSLHSPLQMWPLSLYRENPTTTQTIKSYDRTTSDAFGRIDGLPGMLQEASEAVRNCLFFLSP
jgi:hypothetical protein